MSINKRLSNIVFNAAFRDEIIKDIKSYYGQEGWRVCLNFVEITIAGIEYRIVFLDKTIRVSLFDDTQGYVDEEDNIHDCPFTLGKTIVSINQGKELTKSIDRVLIELTRQAVS